MKSGRKKALIIANQVYEDERFQNLPGAAADARELAEVLDSRTVGEFDVRVLAEPDARSMRREIESFFAEAEREDFLLVHFSCHGRRDEHTRELHFAARDTEHTYVAATGVSARFVNERIEQSRSRRVVLTLDCCYSGSFVRGLRPRGSGTPRVEVDQHFDGQGKAVITACSSLQYSYESTLSSRQPGEPSVFTSTIVEGLRTGNADLDADGFISVEDLYRYVRREVPLKVATQTPELSVDRISGSLFIGRNIQSLHLGTRIAPLIPVALHRAVVAGEAWERFGATLELERLLRDGGSAATRNAAREALIPLTRDEDPEVTERARAVWGREVGSRVPLSAGGLTTGDEPRTETGHTAGIDFGTSNSTIAVLEDGRPVTVANTHGSGLTPSVVGFPPGSGILVGEVARRLAVGHAGRTVSEVKRRLGTGWVVRVDGVEHSAEFVAAHVLERLRLDAEAHLGAPVDSAVITIPANFGVLEREALVHAARLAGIRVLRLINEPTAAAVTYGLNRLSAATVLVFDLGGGTLDVSLLELGDGVVEVRATAGDGGLGGEDWRQCVVDWLVDRCVREHGFDPTDDQRAHRRIRDAAERAKIALSDALTTTITLHYLGSSSEQPRHLEAVLTRAEFEDLTADLLRRCQEPILRVLEDVGLTATDVDHVVLVGGATRMPAVTGLVLAMTGIEPSTGVDPDQAIALGAALQAGVITGQVKDVLLLDVIAESVGIEVMGGVMLPLVHRNDSIPARHSEVFTTAHDNQETARIKVFQGEHALTAENTCLGTFELAGLPIAPRGVPQIEVLVDVDANGIVHVSAKELGTGTNATITVSRDTVQAARTSNDSRNSHPQASSAGTNDVTAAYHLQEHIPFTEQP